MLTYYFVFLWIAMMGATVLLSILIQDFIIELMNAKHKKRDRIH